MDPGMAARLESSAQLAGLIRNAVEGTVRNPGTLFEGEDE